MTIGEFTVTHRDHYDRSAPCGDPIGEWTGFVTPGWGAYIGCTCGAIWFHAEGEETGAQYWWPEAARWAA